MNDTQKKIEKSLNFNLKLLESWQNSFDNCHKSPITCDLEELKRLQLLTESVKNLSQSLEAFNKDEYESR